MAGVLNGLQEGWTVAGKALSKFSMGLDGDGYLITHSIASFRTGWAENG
jgi:hypothetical protein